MPDAMAVLLLVLMVLSWPDVFLVGFLLGRASRRHSPTAKEITQ